jgi:putative membrane protein
MNLPWESLGWTLIFTVTGLGIMFVGLVIFDLLVPFKLFHEIEQGNEAVGWLVSGFLISTGIVLGEAFRHNAGLLQATIFAVMGIILNYLGYFVWEWLTPRWSLSKSIQQRSLAAGKVFFGISVAIGLVIAGSFTF